MTDKEKIIIDGVDVSECLFHEVDINHNNICELNYMSATGYNIWYKCSDNPNCYYKQKTRKEQECEKLQEQISKIKEYVRHNMFDVDCENWFEIFIYTFEDWKKSILENENKYKQECEKYKQTLDEIKSICLKDVHTFADGTQLRYDSLDEILSIATNSDMLPCADPNTDCTKCKDRITEKGKRCMRYGLEKIKNIVEKAKDDKIG